MFVLFHSCQVSEVPVSGSGSPISPKRVGFVRTTKVKLYYRSMSYHYMPPFWFVVRGSTFEVLLSLFFIIIRRNNENHIKCNVHMTMMRYVDFQLEESNNGIALDVR